jgi:hypothetical protein
MEIFLYNNQDLGKIHDKRFTHSILKCTLLYEGSTQLFIDHHRI